MSLKPTLVVKLNSFGDISDSLKNYFYKNDYNLGDVVTLMNGHYHNLHPTFRDPIYAWTQIKFSDGKIIDAHDFDMTWSFATEFTVKGCSKNKYSCFVPV